MTFSIKKIKTFLPFLWRDVRPDVELREEAEEQDRVGRDVVGELQQRK